jgi:hypothetical protein
MAEAECIRSYQPKNRDAEVGVVTFLVVRTNTHYPAMTSRCIQSSNAVGSIEGFANKAYWLAPKTPGRYPAAYRSTVRQKGAMP